MFKSLAANVTLAFCFLLLFACSLSATPAIPTQVSAAPQALIQGNTITEETQTIELDNCDGKADAVRSEQRGQSVDVTVSAEVAAKLGVSAQVIEAEVQATVGAQVTDSGYRSSTIQLVAPPKTRMVFQIVWSGPEQVGIVQNLKSVGIPIAFRQFSPTDVKIKSQIDVGCPRQGPSNPQSSIPTSSPANFPTVVATRKTVPVAIIADITYAIDSTKAWQGTDTHLKPGDILKITYVEGQWTGRHGDGNLSGPDQGSQPQNTEECFPIKQEGSGIIGRIGVGEPFKIGYQFLGNVNQSGELSLRMNDCDKYLFDNFGTITVHIEQTRE